jgi:hypothetical protein
MNDVLSTLAVIATIVIWAWCAFAWAVMHMDIGPTISWWVGQSILLVVALSSIFVIIRWAVTT